MGEASTASPGYMAEDRGSAVVAIFWVEVALATIVVALRFWARFIIKSFGADDWLMLFTLVLFIALTGLETYNASIGGFRHLTSLTQEQGLQVAKINYISQVFVVFSYVTGKAAVGFLVLRIVGPSVHWRKWAIWLVMGLTAVVGTLNCIFTFVQCDPPRALWEPSIPHTCWDPSVQTNFAIFTSAENIFADVVLALVPMSIIFGLKLDIRKRISLGVLLGLGLIAAVCGIIKTTFLASLSSRSDLTWDTYHLFVWSAAELFVIIMCGSIPPLKTLFDRFVANKGYLSYGSASKQSKHNSYYLKPSTAAGRSVSSVKGGQVSMQDLRGFHGIHTTTDIEVSSTRDHSLV